MNSLESNDHQQNETSSAFSYPSFIPITPKTSESSPFKADVPENITNKPISTKLMLQEAIKSLSTKSRKGFSLARIRKYLLDNYLRSADEIKHRMPYMKKFFKSALESGEIKNVKGLGLSGSFRVPRTSKLHKNAKKTLKKREKKNLKRISKKRVNKGRKETQKPRRKPKKVKMAKRKFSAKN